MFTSVSVVMLGLLVWGAHRGNAKDRRFYEVRSDDNTWELTLHIRQDLKLVAFLSAGILVMLGILGDILSCH